MKRLLTILIGVGGLLMLMQSNASAETKGFLSLRVGEALPNFVDSEGESTTGKGAATVGFTLGIQPSDLFRWDLVDFTYFSGEQSNPNRFPGLPNQYADGFSYSNMAIGTTMRWGYFGSDWKVHPYLTFGVAADRSIYEQRVNRESNWYFQWNVGAGVEYEIFENFSLGARYRFSETDFKRYDTKERSHKISAELIVMLFK